jgi:hypothetical protein
MKMISKLKEWLAKLLKNKIAKIPLTQPIVITLYKIHTLKGDTYWIPLDETYRQLGPVIRKEYGGIVYNKDIKLPTIIPWHQIDWLIEEGTITI